MKEGRKMTGSLAAESFRMALRNLLDARGRGSQADLAETLGLARSAINDILTGRRGTSTKTQERIAACFGLSLAEMLRIGENLIHGKTVFPWADQLDGLTKPQQVKKIVDLTNHQVGHSSRNIEFIQAVCDFLEGSLNQAELYQTYLKLVRSRMA